MRARPLAVLLTVAALLLAQQAAISHQIWHLGGAGGQAFAAQSDQPHKAPKKDGLCDLHTALGTVLGAVDSTPVAAAPLDVPQVEVLAGDLPAISATPLSAASRGPPLLS